MTQSKDPVKALRTATAEPPDGAAQVLMAQQQVRDRTLGCLRKRQERYRQGGAIDLQAILKPYLDSLSGLQHKLSQPLVQIAVFGLVSRGKSAVLNALFGEPLFPTGPLNGVTQWPRAVRWSPPLTGKGEAPAVQLELIDTPGLDEVSGAARAAMAQEIARCADLILFVTAGPPLPIEQEALTELGQFGKPIIWVVNKADLFPTLTTDALHADLADAGLRSILSPQEIVLTTAAPAPIQVRHEWPDGRVTVDWEVPPPVVGGLRQAVLTVLEREGLYLLSWNVLRQIQVVEQQMVEAIAEFYASEVTQIQWIFAGLKAGAVSLLPGGLLDILASAVLDIGVVRRLMQQYGLEMTRHRVGALWQAIALSAGWVGLSEMGSALFGVDDLQGWSAWVGAALTQGVAAAYGSSRVSHAAQRYLLDGATWDALGPSHLIEQLRLSLPPEMITARLATQLPPTPESQPVPYRSG